MIFKILVMVTMHERNTVFRRHKISALAFSTLHVILFPKGALFQINLT